MTNAINATQGKVKKVMVEIYEEDLQLLKSYFFTKSSQEAVQRSLISFSRLEDGSGSDMFFRYQGFITQFNPKSKVSRKVRRDTVMAYLSLGSGEKLKWRELKAIELGVSAGLISKWVERYNKGEL